MEDRRARSLNGVSGSLGSLNFDLALVPSPSPTAAWQRENEESSGSAESTLPSNWKVGVSGSSSMKREASLECMSIAHDGGGRDSKRRKLSGNIPEDLLECPVCWDFMFRPIYQCVNGHTVCNGCKGKLSGWCPTCRGVLGNIRCLSLEKVAASLQLPCKFQDKGCAEVLKYDEKEEHEKSCRFRPYRCPVRGCLTVGDVRKIVLHLEHEHQGSPVKEASEISHVFTEPLKHIEDSKRASDPLLYMFQDEYFCLHFEEQRNFLTTSTYSAYITFLGEPTDASKFKYRLEVGRHDRAMIWMGVPRSIRDSLDDITKSNDCLAIPKHLANYFSLGDMQELKLEVRGTIWEKDE